MEKNRRTNRERAFISDLERLVENGTTVVTITTPKGWKCSRKGCNIDWKHTHSTYPSLSKKSHD